MKSLIALSEGTLGGFLFHRIFLSLSLFLGPLLPWLIADEKEVLPIRSLLDNHCQDCHSGAKPSGEFSIENLRSSKNTIEVNVSTIDDWERMLRRLRAGQMPPPDADRPDPTELDKATRAIEQRLEMESFRNPFAGRVDTLRRMNRSEYQNAIRDLLSLDIDAVSLLPKDESSQGFDNITVGELSSTLLNRYLTAAQTISRLALGRQGIGPVGLNVRVPADRTQEAHVEGLPLGTRGGVLIEHEFPRDGAYEVQLRLARDRDERVEGLSQKHSIDVLIDKEPKHRFTVSPPPTPMTSPMLTRT